MRRENGSVVPHGTIRCALSGVIDQQLLELVRRQHGIVSRRQLRDDLGRSDAQIARALRSRILGRVTTVSYRIASSPDSFSSRCIAVSLDLGAKGFVSSWTAARLRGLRKMPRDPIHITIPDGHRVRLPPWCEVHHSSWFSAADWVALDNARVATPLRMLFGLAAVFNQYRFERAAEDAWHLGLVTPEEAGIYLEQHRCRGKDGVTRMERWLERTTTRQKPAQSGLELELLAAIDRIGLPPPQRQYPLELLDGDLIHLDIAWPRIRLGVEPGAMWWHGGDRRQRLDQARDVACGEVGWQILRFDETLRRDPRDAATRIARVYQQRWRGLAS
jgi:hypothetical protein